MCCSPLVLCSVTSSEKVDKAQRYADFTLLSIPYPGTGMMSRGIHKGQVTIRFWGLGNNSLCVYINHWLAECFLCSLWRKNSFKLRTVQWTWMFWQCESALGTLWDGKIISQQSLLIQARRKSPRGGAVWDGLWHLCSSKLLLDAKYVSCSLLCKNPILKGNF